MKTLACLAALVATVLPAAAQTTTATGATVAPKKATKSVLQQEEPVKPDKPGKVEPQEDERLGGTLIDCAERPTSTWTPHVCGEGAIVVEAGIDFASEDGNQLDGKTFTIPTIARYGLSESFELFIVADALINRSGEDPRSGAEIDALGLGDVTLGTKWGILKDGGALPAVGSVALWKLPTADDGEGLGSGEGDLYFITCLGKHLSDYIALNGNFGLAFISDTGEQNSFLMRKLGSVEVRWQIGDITVLGELVWRSQIKPMIGTETFARVGAAYFITEDIRVDLALRIGISEDAEDFALTAGLSIALSGP